MSKSAQIVKILEVKKHPNADSLDLVKVLGWQCVAKLGEFKEGEIVVYIEIDTQLKERPEFEFLRNKNFRVRSIRLRGELSQGLILPLSVLPTGEYHESDDVSELVGASHYEKPIPACLAGQAKGGFPTSLISKTDEERIQNYPALIEYFKGREVYVSVKINGASGSFIKKSADPSVPNDTGEIFVCSRNLNLKDTENNTHWKILRKYDLLDKMPEGYAIQYECYGEGIQGNDLGIKGQDIAVFNVKNLLTGQYLSYDDFKIFCDSLKIPMVPIYYLGIFKWETVEEMLSEADTVKYPNGKDGEGLVWRLRKNETCHKFPNYISVKTVSNKYLIKHGE
jgi:RNA ligase (TIGR02306 family)